VSDGANESFAFVGLTPYFSYELAVSQGDMVRAMVPVDGSLADAWKSVSFDDSSWLSGPTGVGYDNASPNLFGNLIGVDVASQMYKKQTSCYLRAPFTIDNPEQVLSMTLQMKYEDGFVAYLNGVEIARANAPLGTPQWNSIAALNRTDDFALSYESYQVALPEGLLVAGTNVLAIHGLNSGKTTSERRFLIVPELEMLVGATPPVDPNTPFDDVVSLIPNPALRGPQDDGDGDGRSNLFEHGAGTSITEADQAYPMVRPDSVSQVSVLLPANPPQDVRYVIEHCPDLKSSWAVLTSRVGTGPWDPVLAVQQLPEGTDRIRHIFPAPGGACSFFRLRMELVSP
jgi:hypothetical protein